MVLYLPLAELDAQCEIFCALHYRTPRRISADRVGTRIAQVAPMDVDPEEALLDRGALAERVLV